MAYEKQGDAEARKSYEQLIREFGDQPSVVEQARARIAAATAVAAGPTIRRVCSGNECPSGGFAGGGRWMVRVADDQLILADVVTGKSRQVTALGGQRVVGGVVSPDGDRIAYTVTSGMTEAVPNSNSEIFVVDVDGSNRRLVYRGARLATWSPDGRRLLTLAAGESTLTLAWVTLTSGAVQPIPTTGWKNLGVFMVSRDGRHIAFSGNRDGGLSLEKTGGALSNVYLMAADGSGETRVSTSPNLQVPAGWSPDGRYLLYAQYGNPLPRLASDVSLWAVAISEGRAQGAPVLVKDFGKEQLSIIGVMPSGTLHYLLLSATNDIYGAVGRREVWAMENFLPAGR
jgi:dipeptidyl aminopeptidase/acylaminoacyl peptidase